MKKEPSDPYSLEEVFQRITQILEPTWIEQRKAEDQAYKELMREQEERLDDDYDPLPDITSSTNHSTTPLPPQSYRGCPIERDDD